MNVIETKDLTKTYKRFKKKEGLRGSLEGLWKREYEEKTAVSHMDLEIAKGEFVGLIGPNGAGKTTLIKMLTGIIAPTSGSIDVLGFYPNDLKNKFKEQYAVVMGQKSQLFFELTVNDTLRLFKEIYGISEQVYQKNKEFYTELFDVKGLMDVQVRTLSLGERMKMELIVALLHNPQILFLDEPTIGLDAIAAKQMRRFLKEVNEEKGTTILLTSHYMEDIKSLCERSIVINHGAKIYDGNTQELFHKYQRNKKLTVSFEKPVDDFEMPEGAVILEESPMKKVFRINLETVNATMHDIMRYEPIDITIEEDEIGTVVERIYQEGSVKHA
ncbi:MAG: ATP-binding cassette domain-containing protein [Lachnospiraceae bacterium]|nr:ATP-binding cassette domain-containing protein [Lachnospiraceae bacterium]